MAGLKNRDGYSRIKSGFLMKAFLAVPEQKDRKVQNKCMINLVCIVGSMAIENRQARMREMQTITS